MQIVRSACALAILCVLSAVSLQAGPGASLSLNGSTGYVLVPATNLVLVPTPLTFEAWVYPTAGKCNTILSRGNGNTALTDYILDVGYDGTNCGVMKVGFFSGGAWDASTSNIPLKAWTHVAVTFDGTNKAIFVNGAADRTIRRTNALSITTNSPVYIGRQGTICDCNFFQGQLACVRIWDTVRTTNQIVADMATASLDPQPGLVASYNLNEGSGSIANDTSGNGFAGMLINNAVWSNSAPSFPAVSLGLSNRVVGPGAGTDSVVVTIFPNTSSWEATPNAVWLHVSPGFEVGAGNTNVVYTFDANNGGTRTGTIGIGSSTLTVTQAGSTYVAAPAPPTTLASGFEAAQSIAVDAAGNVYVADASLYEIIEWSIQNNTAAPLNITPGLDQPTGVAVDVSGNLYIADAGGVYKWSNNTLTTLVSGTYSPEKIAVDSAGNVYFSDLHSFTVKEWSASGEGITTIISGLSGPEGVAVDAAGNVYVVDRPNNVVEKWSSASGNVSTVVNSGLSQPFDVAVDGAGNLFIADAGHNAIEEWSAASGTLGTVYSAQNLSPEAVAVDAAGNVYFPNLYFGLVMELPRVFVDPASRPESSPAASDALPIILPATENLLPPFAPLTDQGWLAISSATNGMVDFSVATNSGVGRLAHINLFGLNISVQQSGGLNSGVPATTNVTEGPASGLDSVVLSSAFAPWTAIANTNWLHLSPASQSGTGSVNLIFGFDTNTNSTRTGTITVAGKTLTVTQAGASYVQAPTPGAFLFYQGLQNPTGVALDAAGNVFVADKNFQTISEWVTASNTVINLLASQGITPFAVALDAAGNVYFTDSGRGTLSELVASNRALNTVIGPNSGLNQPTGLAVDAAGNVYIADAANNTIEQWSPLSGSLIPLVSGLSGPVGVALDAAGNIYVADSGNGAIKEWLPASNSIITLAFGLNNPTGIGVDASGNVYVDEAGNNAVREWQAASNTVVTLLSGNLNNPYGLAVNAAGDVYVGDSGGEVIRKLPHAWIDPTSKLEANTAGADVLPPVLPAGESLLPPFAPFSDHSWLTVTSVSNGSINLAFTANAGMARNAGVELLGVDVPVTQASAANLSTLGFTNRVEGPGAGSDSVVLGIFPATNSWTAGTNASWLHLGTGYQSGNGSANIIFSFDANTAAAARTGTITIANLTLTVIQAGSNYVSAPASFTTIVGSGLNSPGSVSADSAGNLYFADSGNGAIKEWIATNNSVVTLASSGFSFPEGVAVDSGGNVYIADTFNNSLKEWIAATHGVITLTSSGLNQPYDVAVDGADNVYITDYGNHVIKELDVGTLVSSGLNSPYGLAVDAAGNVYYSDNVNNFIGEWSPADNSATPVLTSEVFSPYGPAVDGAGNIYFESLGQNSFWEYSVAQNNQTKLAPSQTHGPRGMTADAAGNVYIADTGAGRIAELPRAFLDPTPRIISAGIGSGSLPAVLPSTENLTGPFNPASDQSWLTISGVSNGVVGFSVSANTGAVRVGHITVLGQSVVVMQESPTKLVSPVLLGNGSFRFSFTNAPGASFTVLTTTNLALPFNQWTPAGAPVENPPGQYLYTSPAATNSHRYYILRAP